MRTQLPGASFVQKGEQSISWKLPADLVDGEKIGMAREQGDGTLAFDDLNAARFPNRFYRVVSA